MKVGRDEMTVDLVIKNGKIVNTESVISGGLAIDEGKIVAVAKDSSLPNADKTIDACGNFILPGIIETHCHLGLYKPFKDDIITETAAAACGGITTNTTMLSPTVGNEWPPKSHKDFISSLAKIVDDKSTIDVVFHLFTSTELIEKENAMSDCIETGVTSFKTPLNRAEYSIGGEVDFGLKPLDDGQVFTLLEKARDLGGICMFHCENFELIRKIKERVMREGPKRADLASWAEARPDFAEHEHIAKMAWYGKLTGCPVYIVHVSHGAFTPIANWAKKNSVEISFETIAQYLALTTDGDESEKIKNDEKLGVLGRVNPPVRTKKDREMLWRSIKEGYIHTIGSDHTPTERENKLGGGTMWTAGPAAMANSELLLPIMLSEGVNKREVPITKIAEICSYNPARIFSIPNKGSLSVGNDGDLVIVDLKKKVKVSTDILHGSTNFTVFEDWEMTGWPIATVSRGEIVAQDGQIVGKPGHGKYVKTKPRKISSRKTVSALIDYFA